MPIDGSPSKTTYR